jgi:hypothetical protein
MSDLMIRNVCILLLMLMSCTGSKETPPEVIESYRLLKSELDEDAIGESIKKLEDFRKDNSQYKISWIIEEDMAGLKENVDGRFHMARELARGGDLERSEKMINDLANYLPDTKEGELAEEYLQFEFHQFKATRLMMDERFDEAEHVIIELLKKDLTEQQTIHAENLLDGINTAIHGRSRAESQKMKAACHKLYTLLRMHEARRGEYPNSLTLASFSLGDKSDQQFIKNNLSSIDRYKVTREGFSFVAIGRDGTTAIPVTQDGVGK